MTNLLRNIFLALHTRITAKVIIALLGTTTLIVLLYAETYRRMERSWLDENAFQRAEILTRMIHHELTEAEERHGGDPALPEFLSELSGQHIERIDLLDKDGTIVGSTLTDNLHIGGKSVEQRRYVLPLHGPGLCHENEPERATRVHRVAVYFLPDNRISWLQTSRRTMTWSAALIIVAITGVIIIVIWIVVQKPISRLMETVSGIRQGDLDVHCDLPVEDELGKLAENINDMLASLKEKRDELHALHEAHLVQADRLASVGELASGLAHEIKNPLHGVSSALQIIGRRGDESTQGIITEIQSQIRRVVKIVDDLMFYARPRNPRFELVDIRGILERTLILLNADFQTHKIELTQNIGANIPRTQADPEKIQQVLLNLLLNAVQATGDGNGIEVSLEWNKESGLIEITISDDGPGVPPELAPRVFEPFFTTKKGGHGLGLAITKMLVTEHHGEIKLIPREKGACFQISLPVVNSAVAPGVDAGKGGDEGDATALDAYLFGLACRCPVGNEAHCPAGKLREIRKLDLAERYDAVRGLPREEKLLIQAGHIDCCYKHQSKAKLMEAAGNPED